MTFHRVYQLTVVLMLLCLPAWAQDACLQWKQQCLANKTSPACKQYRLQCGVVTQMSRIRDVNLENNTPFQVQVRLFAVSPDGHSEREVSLPSRIELAPHETRLFDKFLEPGKHRLYFEAGYKATVIDQLLARSSVYSYGSLEANKWLEIKGDEQTTQVYDLILQTRDFKWLASEKKGPFATLKIKNLANVPVQVSRVKMNVVSGARITDTVRQESTMVESMVRLQPQESVTLHGFLDVGRTTLLVEALSAYRLPKMEFKESFTVNNNASETFEKAETLTITQNRFEF